MKKTGFFITLEGGEGAGKSTQIARLAKHLQKKGYLCCVTREPGGTSLAEKLREVVKHFQEQETVTSLTELLLMEAARSQHCANRILPALERGEVVICDRFYDSTTAYQGYGRHMDLELIVKLNSAATEGRAPDLTLLLDLPVEQGLSRAGRRAATQGKFDRFEQEKQDFFETVRQGFLAIASAEPHRVVRIDAAQDADAVTQQIFEAVDAAL